MANVRLLLLDCGAANEDGSDELVSPKSKGHGMHEDVIAFTVISIAVVVFLALVLGVLG